MKIATWNVNSLKVRLPQVTSWLQSWQPDVLCLQETKLDDPHFPASQLLDIGYHSVFHGQPAYNGVAILSREPPASVQTGWPGEWDAQARLCSAVFGGIRVLNVYVPNGQSLDSEKYAYKLHWLERLRIHIAEELERCTALLLLGDFNIAPDGRDVYDPEAWGEDVLCSPAERLALQNIQSMGLHDVFRQQYPDTRAWSWWDYRAGRFRRDQGLRIDLILASSVLLPRIREVSIDRETRAAERPSDHAPVCLLLEDGS